MHVDIDWDHFKGLDPLFTVQRYLRGASDRGQLMSR